MDNSDLRCIEVRILRIRLNLFNLIPLSTVLKALELNKRIFKHSIPMRVNKLMDSGINIINLLKSKFLAKW